ncbi:hypothetical protein F4802DRAFT_548523 [Xylaria palmicola]|nr:hypothetical protein F4802DRAFT_548523 [Xylaria palmicola]
MFTCRACLRRAFDHLSGHSLPGNLYTNRYTRLPLRAGAKPPRSNRRYATAAADTASADKTNSSVVSDSTDHSGRRAPALRRSTDWAARKELEYLGDPLHIANRVRLALGKDNLELASEITRQASKDHNVTVSWNYLIDYQLQHGRLHAALKLYNEMKKRAQLPNAQTFTIIFRGCAKSEHPKLAVAEAVKLYQNMLSVGRIKPNVIHLNAVLQVCAKVGDLDSMFTILNSSDDPLRSPNNLTYTTIFNALRMKADKQPANEDDTGRLTEREIEREKQSAIQRARTIWEEVISRWKSGSLIIDEELVCAMGRILLMGGYREADGIEGLLEQTMMIPRAENKGLPLPEGTKNTDPAAPRSVTKAPGAPAFTHAVPGNNSLSMILEAVEKTGRTTKAIKYWNVFTQHYKVVPDADNWTRALGVFQRGKNSGRAATTLRSMPSHVVTPKHVRLAMKTCLRDNLNKSALDNATVILQVMGRSLRAPDMRAMRTYLQVAHASKRSFDKEAQHDYAGAIDSWAKNMAAALDHLFGPYQTAVKKYFNGSPNTKDSKASALAQNSKTEVVALARKMSAAYDILNNEHSTSLTAAQVAAMKPRQASLTRLVTDYFQTVKAHPGDEAGQQEDVQDRRFKQRGSMEKARVRRQRDYDDEDFDHKRV